MARDICTNEVFQSETFYRIDWDELSVKDITDAQFTTTHYERLKTMRPRLPPGACGWVFRRREEAVSHLLKQIRKDILDAADNLKKQKARYVKAIEATDE